MAQTDIEWCDYVWNPIRGCTKVSPGCKHCYAETFAERFRGVPGHPFEQGFDLRLVPEMLAKPMEWKKPRRIFVNSMSDLFHEDVPDTYVHLVFEAMRRAPQHTYLVLTKRADWMLDCVDDMQLPSNLWLGVSVEDRKYGLPRIVPLRSTHPAVRFLSIEPLLEDLGTIDLTGIAWVIVGGESGPKARPMHPDWVRSIRDQCQAAKVPFFLKQWGEWAPYVDESKFTYNQEENDRNAQPWMERSGNGGTCWISDGDLGWSNHTGDRTDSGDVCVFSRLGKKRSGRELDGRTWDEFPEVTRG